MSTMRILPVEPNGSAPPGSISVAILSFNRRDELHRTLTELERTPDLWHEVIVADNASTDGTVAMVGGDFPRVRLIDTGGNLGIVGSNLAYAAATGDWILSLDDDSSPVAHTLHDVRSTLADGCDAAAIALSVRREWVPPAARPAGAVLAPGFGFSSAGVLFNRRALASVGLYDPELFLFTNELHWTARALGTGWAIMKADDACVIHRSVPANRSSVRHAHLYCRNLFLFLLRYVPAPEARLLGFRYLQRALAYSILHRTSLYLRGVREGLELHRQSLHRRRPLSADVLAQVNPDWRVGFSFLG